MCRTALAGIGLACLLAAGAQASPCGDEVADLADTFGISTVLPQAPGVDATPATPPATVESRGLLGTDNVAPPLAESDGVIEAPPVGKTPIIDPPAVDGGMSTAPPVSPPRAETNTDVMAAEQRQQAASLLTAAREADEQGRTDDCMERLNEAKAILPLR